MYKIISLSAYSSWEIYSYSLAILNLGLPEIVLALFQNENKRDFRFNFVLLAVGYVEHVRSTLLLAWIYRDANKTCEKLYITSNSCRDTCGLYYSIYGSIGHALAVCYVYSHDSNM